MVSAETRNKERFIVLDGMRGLAALVVITDHVHSPLLAGLLPGRYLAVDFFFVLSGFVLAHVYGRALAQGMSVVDLMRERVIRLFPLYLVGTAAGAGLALVHALRGWSDASLEQVLASTVFGAFLVPCPPGLSLWPDAPFPLNPPAWSLFFELLINLVFAMVGRRLSPGVCMAFMAVGAALLVPAAVGFGRLDGGFAWSNFVAGFPRVTFGFFTGVLLYQLRVHERLPALSVWAALAALLGAFMIPASGVWRMGYDVLAALVIFPVLVAFSAGSNVRGPARRACATVGLLSYGVYILHVPIWGWLQPVLDRLDVELPGLALVALTAVVALTATAVLELVYDRPVRKRLSAWRRGRSGGLEG